MHTYRFRILLALAALGLYQAPAWAAGTSYDYRDLAGRDADTASAERWLAFAPFEEQTPVVPLNFESRYAVNDWLNRAQPKPINSGVVPSRFDGVLHSQGVTPTLQLNAFAGAPKDNPALTNRTLYGVGLDTKAPPQQWNASFYSIQQEVDGITDRQAIGATLRFEEPNRTFRSLFDYDTSFDELNVARVQGTWKTGPAAWNYMLDRHKTPTLQTSTGLAGEATNAIDSLLQTLPEDELRRRAKALTAVSKEATVGVTRPLVGKWHVGGDVKLSHTTGTTGTELLAATPDTGNVYTYTVRTNANNLLLAKDGARVDVSFIEAPTYSGQAYTPTYRSQLGPHWTMDASMRWYDQTDVNNVALESVTPTVRLGYKWKNNTTVAAEVGREETKTTGASFSDEVRRDFVQIGYRRDF